MKRLQLLRLFSTTGGADPVKVNKFNQTRVYRPDPKIALVIKSNANDNLNQMEKERYNKQVRETALGLYKNFKRT
jgi:hypothetical protein